MPGTQSWHRVSCSGSLAPLGELSQQNRSTVRPGLLIKHSRGSHLHTTEMGPWSSKEMVSNATVKQPKARVNLRNNNWQILQ